MVGKAPTDPIFAESDVFCFVLFVCVFAGFLEEKNCLILAGLLLDDVGVRVG